MSTPLPHEAYAAALAGLPRMTPLRLSVLLRHLAPDEAFAVASGRDSAVAGSMVSKLLGDAELRGMWAVGSRSGSPEAVWQRCEQLGIAVSFAGQAHHPVAATTDPLPASVLFSRGDRGLLEGRRVAVVGTRNATMAGRSMARELGRGLAYSGVNVVSGLARGIDAQAHRGVFVLRDESPAAARGGAIGVVASGLDRVYPRENRDLWERVATEGLLLSESPPGAEPFAYRFPLRNRLVAGLSEIVVVVESRERGGSLITATLAAERDIPVMAVPGIASNRAALGTNGLLRDGMPPVLDVADILLALSLDHTRCTPAVYEHRAPPRPSDLATYRACREQPQTIGDIAQHHDVNLLMAAMSLARLEQTGWIAQVDGWYEAVGSPMR